METENLPKEITDTNASANVSACLDRIEKERNNVCSTGFTNLDTILAGGLRGGRLYMICSINSPGKTTFALNIANNVANVSPYGRGRGREVLIYSLETSSDELILKSLMRIYNRNSHGANDALTYADIVSVKDPYTDSGVSSRLSSAVKHYSDGRGKNVYIKEGRYIDIGEEKLDALSHLKSFLENFSKYDRKPLVVIDYLELLPPHSDVNFTDKQTDRHLTDKQIIYENVNTLKQIAVKYDVPIIVVSSFNRNNYIDYGADVVLGLQLAEEQGNAEPACHKIELKIINDRLLKFDDTIHFNYYQQFCCFEQV